MKITFRTDGPRVLALEEKVGLDGYPVFKVLASGEKFADVASEVYSMVRRQECATTSASRFS